MTSTEMAPTIKGIVYRIPVERLLSVLNFPMALGSQNNSHKKGNEPSATSIIRQFQWSKIHPEKGDANITAPGKHSSQNALARARSERENQCESRIKVAG